MSFFTAQIFTFHAKAEENCFRENANQLKLEEYVMSAHPNNQR